MYDAYGRQTVLANNGVVAYKPSDYGQFVGFTGRYHDYETGLQYFRARYFDNSLGRFIGRDPAGYVDGSSLYSGYFVPNGMDPSGLIGVYLEGLKIGPGESPFTWFMRNYIRECEEYQRSMNSEYHKTKAKDEKECQKGPIELDCQKAALAEAKRIRPELMPNADWEEFKKSYNALVDKAINKEFADDITMIGSMGIGGVGRTILANAAKGAAFEGQVFQGLQQTQTNVVKQITVRTESGTVTRLDFVGRDAATGDVVLTEAKSSITAPLTRNQAAGFPEIEKSGATVLGAGKPGFPGGTQLPPSPVTVVRP